MASDLELAMLRFLNKERRKPGQRECVESLMGLDDMFLSNKEPRDTVVDLPCGGGKTLRFIDGSTVAAGMNIIIVSLNGISREIKQNNQPIQKWYQPYESYIARRRRKRLKGLW